jgi:hypothetical protein
VSAAIVQLALALERGEVARVSLHSTNPDRLAQDLVDAGARCETPVSERETLAGGVRLRWRQGLVVVDRVPVTVASEMTPMQRNPLLDVGIEDEIDRAMGGG